MFSRAALAALLLSTAFATSLQAMFVQPTAVPVDRILRNAETYLKQHPQEALAHYTLARIHYLAFHLKYDHVPAFDRGQKEGALPQPAAQWMAGWVRMEEVKDTTPHSLSSREMVDHASHAAAEFKEALALEPQNGLYHLGLASLLEEFATYRDTSLSKEQEKAALPAALQGIDAGMIRRAYAQALEESMKLDSVLKTKPMSTLRAVPSYEAATAIVRLATGHEDTLTAQEKNDLQRAQSALRFFEKLPPPGMVTPIVFALRPVAHLADLRGYGWRERWPWIKPELGLLVWDPQHTGRITSAQQLFGGYTFQIFHETGYDALAALDDNGDGQLTGAELTGLSAWFDRDGDAHSTPEELIPLEKLGVVALSVKSTAHDGIHPTNAQGITFRDGRTLPTWDWMVQPVREEAALVRK